MASSTSSLALYCVLLSLTALAVTVRPALLADERTQIDTVLDVLYDSSLSASQARQVAENLARDPTNVVSDCLRISELLNSTVDEFTRSNTRLGALDADHKLTPFNYDDGFSVEWSLEDFARKQQAAVEKLLAQRLLFCVYGPFCMDPFGVAVVKLNDEVGTFASYVMRVIPSDSKSAVEEQFGSLNKPLTLAKSSFTCYPAFTSVLRSTVTGV